MPSHIDDIAASFDQAWQRFLATDSLRVEGDTLDADWSRGRAQYLAFLVRIEDASARARLAHICEAIAAIPGVEPYPEWYWHATVKGAGFQVIKRTHDDDVLRQDVPMIIAAAKDLLTSEPAFDAQLGPVNAFDEVAIVEVQEGGHIRELNTRLREAIPQLHQYPFDGARFLPHVSIARFRSNDGLAQLKEALASLRAEGAGPTFPVRRVEFIRAWLTEDFPEFETLASYALAAPKGAS